MREIKIIVFIFIIHVAYTFSPQSEKTGRTLFPLLKKLFGYTPKCGSRSCPPWKCQDDSAVIHGYCCQCPGSEYYNIPVTCYPDHLKCPISPEPLCSDYRFMIECCCTGA